MARYPQLPVVRHIPPIPGATTWGRLFEQTLPQRFYPGGGYIPMYGPNWGPADHPEFFSPGEMRSPVPGSGGPVVASAETISGGEGSDTLMGAGGIDTLMGAGGAKMAGYTNPVGGSQAGNDIWDPKAVPYSGGRAYSRSFGGPRGGTRHTAVDIPADVGDPVYAVQDGVIRRNEKSSSGYGYVVDIEYPDGTVHRAAHLDGAGPYAVGTSVPAGAEIAKAGHSGNADASFTHVHYEVINAPYYNAKGGLPPGRTSRSELAVGRQDPRLYFAGYKGPDAVKQFQQEAQAAGYYDGAIDGIAGPGTEGAIEQMASAGAIGGLVGSAAPPSALASLTNPTGGTQVASPPNPLQSFMPPAMNATPAQQAIEQAIAPQPQRPAPVSQPLQVPPQWNPATGFPQPPQRPGPGGALGVDLGMQPAGMPVPQPRPADRWQPGAGGAPAAGLVPAPGISPFRPAMGGPNDRRPQPPVPTQRPAVGIPDPRMRPANYQWLGGGAPDAGTVPSPPPRGTPYVPTFPGVYGEQPAPPAALQSPVGARPEYPGQMPAAPFKTPYGGPPPIAGASPGGMPAAPRTGDLSAAMGNAPAPAPLPPGPDGISPLFDPGSEYAAGIRLYRPNTPQQPPALPPWSPTVAGRTEYPGAMPAAPRAGDLSAAMGGPPAPQVRDFSQAAPSLSLPPSWSPVTSFPPPAARTGTVEAGSTGGEWFTPAPPMPAPMPAPMADANAGRFDVFNMSSNGPIIMDPYAAYQDRPAPPSPTYPSPIGSEPAVAGQPGARGSAGPAGQAGASTFDVGRFDAAGPARATAPAAPTVPYVPVAGQRVVGEYDPVTQTFTPDAPMDLTKPYTGPKIPVPGGPSTAAAPVPQATQTQPQTSPTGPFANATRPGLGIHSFVPGGSFLGPRAVFGLGNAGSFTPSGAAGAGGTSYFNQQLGAGPTQTTQWRQGSVTGNPAMDGVMWNRSGGNGSVGYVTDPVTGFDHPIYTGSPNSF